MKGKVTEYLILQKTTETQERLINILNRNLRDSYVPGKFGLGVWNEVGQRLIEFSQENTLVIADTFFQQHKRRLCTWISPDG